MEDSMMNLVTINIDQAIVVINLDQVRYIQQSDDGYYTIHFSETHQIGLPPKSGGLLMQEFMSSKRSMDLRK
jgi:hypothetical protein